MWGLRKWIKDTWNYLTGGGKPATPAAQPHSTPPANALPLKGNIWMMDPETHIVTRMLAVADPADKMHGFKLVSTGERAFIPQSQTHLESRPVVDTEKVARDRAKLTADMEKLQHDLSHNKGGKNQNSIVADTAQIEKDKKQLMADLHPAPSPTYVLNPMPAAGTLVNGIPVFQRRAGHRVATLDVGHGVSRYSTSPDKPITAKTHIDYDPGSKSIGSLSAGATVTEGVINLHFGKDAAVAFARNGWDTIITRSDNEPRFAGRGFGFRIDAANQADVYISLHADQRLGDPKKDPAAAERLAIQAKVERIKAQHGNLSALNDHEKAVLKDIDDKTGVRVYIDRRIGVDDHSLAFGTYLDTAHSKADLIQDGYVRRPGFLMIHGEKIRGPLSVLLEPGAIDIAHDEANLRSMTYRQAFAHRLVEKTDAFYQQCLPALRSGHTQPAPCTTPYPDTETRAVAAPKPQPTAPVVAPITHLATPAAPAAKPTPQAAPEKPQQKHDPKPQHETERDHEPAPVRYPHPIRDDMERIMGPMLRDKRHPIKDHRDEPPAPPGATPRGAKHATYPLRK